MDRPRFIDDQRVFILDAEGRDAKTYLRPQEFRVPRLEAADRREGSSASHWFPSNRMAVLLNPEYRRICLTGDAGLGKTTSLEWTAKEIASRHPAELPLHVRLSDLPLLREHWGRTFVDLLRRCPGNDSIGDEEGRIFLEKLLRNGAITFLIDALDQTHSGGELFDNPRVRALRDFGEIEARNCRIIVATRPYAIAQYWDDLFSRGAWRFAQLDYFTPTQAREYLGDKRFDYLQTLDVESLLVPRWLSVIRRLDERHLHRLRTAGEVYWEGIREMLELGVQTDPAQQARFQVDDAVRLLGLVAFEMTKEGNFHGLGEGDLTDDFLQSLWKKARATWLGWKRFEDFRRQWNVLGQMNEGLEQGFWEGWGLHQVWWRDRSLQEFFTALWLARYASPEDHTWLSQRQFMHGNSSSSDLYWVWRFAAELPIACRDSYRWIACFEATYRPPKHPDDGRPTEMLYRSWPTMTLCALRLPKAKECIAQFQSEFIKVQQGDCGDWKKKIAEDLLANFREIPPKATEQLISYSMGAPEEETGRHPQAHVHQVSITPFRMCCYAITNTEYELFDPAHQTIRWPTPRSDDDHAPVTNVTWYDAWAFCRWLGPDYRLPTEAEREFACRGGTSTPFSCGRHLTSEKANFNGNFPYGPAPAVTGLFRGRTTPVGSFPANDFGLFDMHGNVWEWCGDWYDEEFYEHSPTENPVGPTRGEQRVIRGGGWFSKGEDCRSSSRFAAETGSAANFNIGFRPVASSFNPETARGIEPYWRTLDVHDNWGRRQVILLLDHAPTGPNQESAVSVYLSALKEVGAKFESHADRSLDDRLFVIHYNWNEECDEDEATRLSASRRLVTARSLTEALVQLRKLLANLPNRGIGDANVIVLNVTHTESSSQSDAAGLDGLRECNDRLTGFLVFNMVVTPQGGRELVYPASPAYLEGNRFAEALFHASSEFPESMRRSASLLVPVVKGRLLPGDRGFAWSWKPTVFVHLFTVCLTT
jgi:hypothetical protein